MYHNIINPIINTKYIKIGVVQTQNTNCQNNKPSNQGNASINKTLPNAIAIMNIPNIMSGQLSKI